MQPKPSEPRPQGPRAITRVFDLLKVLSGKTDGLTLAELSTATSVAKSTMIDTLRGLCDSRYLRLRDGRYFLGPAAYHFASRIVANWSAADMVSQQVRKLADETGESVGFAIVDWDIGQAFYTVAMNSRHPVRYAMHPGLRAPLYASAAGRVLLAFAETERVENYFARAHLKSLTGATRTSPEVIRENLRQIRADGYCASFGEMLPDTAAIAVPVRGPEGEHVGALMVAAPLDRMKANYERLLEATIEAGHQASAESA